MKKSSFGYVTAAKRKLGGPYRLKVSDAALGRHFECSEGMIAKAKAGNMSDPLAIKIAEFIEEDPGEVLLVARAERERDQVVKAHLLQYAKKALRLVSSKAAVLLSAVALSAFSPQPAEAGGSGVPCAELSQHFTAHHLTRCFEGNRTIDHFTASHDVPHNLT